MSVEYGESTSKGGGNIALHQDPNRVEDANAAAVYEKYGNQYDEMDMDRMGKLQELRVSVIGRRETGISRWHTDKPLNSETSNSCPFLATL